MKYSYVLGPLLRSLEGLRNCTLHHTAFLMEFYEKDKKVVLLLLTACFDLFRVVRLITSGSTTFVI